MPRAARLVRVRDLRAAHRAIAALACAGPPLQARTRLVLVPTTGAAWQLRRTIERLFLVEGWRPAADVCEQLGTEPPARPGPLVLPDLLTRSEWYEQLHALAASPPPWPTDIEREVILRAACEEVAEAGLPAPFTLRPGLVAEILAFDATLQRQRRTVDDLERLATERFEPSADTDRGAARLLAQARFLVAALRAYRRRLASLGAVDEHAWIARVAGGAAPSPYQQVVVTVADQAAEPSGLWPCDFDVLTRLPGLARIDVVVTDAVLDTGFHERLHERVPGIEECRADAMDASRPVLVAPPREEERLYFVSRDREDEMASAARRLVTAAPSLDTAALVFQRPLPYLYVGRQLLDVQGVPCEAADELPLAAEPAAAALDVVLTFVTSAFTRPAILALLRSPHVRIEVDGGPPSAFDVAQFDERAREAGYVGGRDRLVHLAARLEADGATHPRAAAAARAARAAVAAASALGPAETRDRASVLLDTVIAFLETHTPPTPIPAPWAERERRARGALQDVLRGLRDACRQHGDRETTLLELSADIRHCVERHTFAPRAGEGGLQLVDELAARYGHFAHVHLLGLVEGEWPRAPARNVFFPTVLLRDLGWPRDEDRQAAARASFVDLLALASGEVSMSAFCLEDDALVRPSVLVEELDHAGLEVRHAEAAADDASQGRAEPAAPAWWTLRASREAPDEARFHGQAGPTDVPRHSVTGIETYLDCPFRYFARKVLRLEEERPEEPGLDSLARGRFVHTVFERFFAEWGRDGHGAITPEQVPAARARFAALVEEMLATLPPGDRAVERVRLLGSPAVAGFGERAFRLEAARPTPVVARRMEVQFDDEYEFVAGDRSCRIRLRGVADRIDLLADGTLRVIDYKSGVAPAVKRAVQLPVYGTLAERAFEGDLGRSWRVAEAAYLAFGDRRSYVPVITSAEERDAVVDAAVGRLVRAVEAIARGEFPPRPAEWGLCGSCAFAAICRKDYVDAD